MLLFSHGKLQYLIQVLCICITTLNKHFGVKITVHHLGQEQTRLELKNRRINYVSNQVDTQLIGYKEPSVFVYFVNLMM